jgi:hypothetical protein
LELNDNCNWLDFEIHSSTGIFKKKHVTSVSGGSVGRLCMELLLPIYSYYYIYVYGE